MVALGTLKPSPVQTNIEVAYSGGKCVLVAVVTCLAMMSVTPALAAPRQIENLCSELHDHDRARAGLRIEENDLTLPSRVL